MDGVPRTGNETGRQCAHHGRRANSTAGNSLSGAPDPRFPILVPTDRPIRKTGVVPCEPTFGAHQGKVATAVTGLGDTAMDIAALQASWRTVERAGDDAILYFYSHLFTAHPEVRDMFPLHMADQRGKFFTALGRIVSDVERLEDDPRFLEQLGRDHRKFRVIPDHYPAAGASLLATLRIVLGREWTETLAGDWARAYDVVASILVSAAAANEADAPAWWDARVLASERRGTDIAVLRIRPTRPYPYRPGQSISVEIPQRPRLWRSYTPANAPRPDAVMALHVQIVAGGQVSSALAHEVGPGDIVRLGPPTGTALTLPPAFRGNLVMIAGGSGLAPMTALLDQLDKATRAGHTSNVRLFHGVRTPSNLYEHTRLTDWARTRPWFHYTPVVSEDPTFPGDRGNVGTVSAHADDWTGYAALVCGSSAMVDHTVAELVARGMPHTAIRREGFDAGGYLDHPPIVLDAATDTAHEVPA